MYVHAKTKARFGCLLRPPAWKPSRFILTSTKPTRAVANTEVLCTGGIMGVSLLLQVFVKWARRQKEGRRSEIMIAMRVAASISEWSNLTTDTAWHGLLRHLSFLYTTEALTQGRTDHFKNISFPWLWTLTDDLDRRTRSRRTRMPNVWVSGRFFRKLLSTQTDTHATDRLHYTRTTEIMVDKNASRHSKTNERLGWWQTGDEGWRGRDIVLCSVHTTTAVCLSVCLFGFSQHVYELSVLVTAADVDARRTIVLPLSVKHQPSRSAKL